MMRAGLAGRMSRVLVGRHPRRWRERYGEEMLDVLDQHRPTARTVASLAVSALSTHLDPAYRAERLSLSRLRRVAVVSGAVAVGLALAEAFSPDGQTLAVAYTDRIFLWDTASAARPRLVGTLAAPVTSVGQASFSPQDIAFSPDGRILASVDGTGQVTVWNVADPARAVRLATLNGLRDYVEAIAFSPDGTLLAAVTYYGTVGVFSLADPARPALTTTISGIMARALYPDGLLQHPDAPPCPSCSPASYAVAFTPDGRTLTVVVARQEGNVTGAAFKINTRDTVFTWNVTSSGMVSDLTTVTHDGDDLQPTLAPDGRTVADGSYTSNAVSLWMPAP